MKGLRIRRATLSSVACLTLAASLLMGSTALRAFAVAPGEIVLGDIVVMRLRTASGGVSPEQRASLVQERVNEILAIPNLTAKDVTIVKSSYGPTLYVRKIKLITIDVDTAKDQGVTPDVLAKTWAHRLMGIIAQVDIRLPGGPPAPGTTPAVTPAIPATGTPTVPNATPTATPPVTPTPAPPVPTTTPTTTPAPTTPATPPAPDTPTPNSTPKAPVAPDTPTPPADKPAAPATPAPATPTPAAPSPATPTPPPAPAANP